jgi:hypothetical protein
MEVLQRLRRTTELLGQSRDVEMGVGVLGIQTRGL